MTKNRERIIQEYKRFFEGKIKLERLVASTTSFLDKEQYWNSREEEKQYGDRKIVENVVRLVKVFYEGESTDRLATEAARMLY